VLLALGFSTLAALVLVFTPGRTSLAWNVAQVLALLAAGSLLAGMLGLYPMSVRAEQEVQRERVVLLRRALEASDAERRRIARDLHDSAVQDLAAVSFSLAGTSRRVAGEGRPELAELLNDAATATRHTMAGLRSLIVEIYPPNLHKEGLEAAITDLCASARSRGLNVQVEVTPGLELSEQAAATVYRIAQEAVRNTLRHSRARQLCVSLLKEEGLVRLEVTDDGRGFDGSLTASDGHIGLRLVSDLAREAGGRLEIKSGPGCGAVVRLEMIA
jgi:signal transduction histidine kinase